MFYGLYVELTNTRCLNCCIFSTNKIIQLKLRFNFINNVLNVHENRCEQFSP